MKVAIVKNAPNSLIWSVTLVVLGIIGAFVVLSVTGSDAAELRSFLNTLMNIAATAFSGGALVVAGAAARSAGQAQQQTENGTVREAARAGAQQALNANRKL